MTATWQLGPYTLRLMPGVEPPPQEPERAWPEVSPAVERSYGRPLAALLGEHDDGDELDVRFLASSSTTRTVSMWRYAEMAWDETPSDPLADILRARDLLMADSGPLPPVRVFCCGCATLGRPPRMSQPDDIFCADCDAGWRRADAIKRRCGETNGANLRLWRAVMRKG